MGLFSCCLGGGKQPRSESEARHARIVDIYTQAALDAQAPASVPPPSYQEVGGDAVTRGLPSLIVEKEPYQPPAEMLPRPKSPAPSVHTSIRSVPSTRLTDVTYAHTGATSTTIGHEQNDEFMSASLVFDSAPPSYYDGRSIRERSRSPEGQRQSTEQQNPVTTEDWLEILQRTAQAAESYIRGLERT